MEADLARRHPLRITVAGRPQQYIREPNGSVYPASWAEWALWLEHHSALRIVRRTHLPDGNMVSTVFLGLDHAFLGGPPILWETWSTKHDSIDRYTSEGAAIADHERIVQMAETLPREVEA